MRDAWRIAARNLMRNRRRNLATAAAIALGYAAMVLLGGYLVRVERFLRANTVYLQRTGHLAVYREGGLERAAAQPAKYSLSADDQERVIAALRAEPRVEMVARYLVGMGLAGNGCKTMPFVATGVEPEIEARVRNHPQVLAASPELARPLRGRDLAAYAQLPGATGLSTGLARLLGKHKVHDELGEAPPGPAVPDCAAPDIAAQLAADANIQLAGLTWSGSLSAVDAEIVSVFRTPLAETEDSTVVTGLATLQQLFDTDAVTYLAVFLRDARDAKLLAPQLEQRLRAAGLAVSVYSFDDERVGPYYVGTMAMLNAIVVFIGLLVVTVIVLSVLNAMTLSVLERTRELGTFRALGFTRRQLLGLYVREALILAGLAIGAGLVLSLSVAWGVNAADVRFSPPGIPGTIQLIITPTPLVCVVLAAVMAPSTALATWIAVRRRVRTPVVGLLTSAAA